MDSRERIRRAIRHQEADRVPITEIGYWPDTIDRWESEGLPWGVDPNDYFEVDYIARYGFDCTLRLPTRTLEETDEWVIALDSNGVTRKRWKKNYATPGHADPSIATRADWERVKGSLKPDVDRLIQDVNGNRFAGSVQAFRIRERMGAYRTINPLEPAWFALSLMGFEQALTVFGEDPELAEDMFATCTNFNLGMMQLAIDRGMEFDGVWVFADLCYRNGMLFSPRFYHERLARYHRQYADFCHERGLDFIIHCDGDVRKFIPLLVETGFDCVQPLEARQGNDVRELKSRFGSQIALFGNISADVMSQTKSAIEEEVSTKVEAAKGGGGYIFHSDHSVPPLISFDNYCFVMEQAKKHGGY